MWRIPSCGKDEVLNALIHAGLGTLYLACVIYHFSCTREHLARHRGKSA